MALFNQAFFTVRSKVFQGWREPAVEKVENKIPLGLNRRPARTLVKESVSRLSSYVVPQDNDCVKLNQNESPFDIPEKLKREITNRLMTLQWNRYPSNFGESLLEKLSDYIQHPAPGTIIGNSSNELIQAAIYSFCDSGDRVVVTRPGFPIYPRVASVMNIKVREVPLDKGFNFDIPRIIKASRGARMVMLASPNNPTGAALSTREIARLARGIDGILLLDEAYHEFFPQDTHELLREYPNLVIVRTFSKAFNLAGIRLGYMMANQALARELRKSKLPFSVGMFQQVTGEVVMENREFMETGVSSVVKERERLMTSLKETPGIAPFPSRANFILFLSQKLPGEMLFRALRQKGVLVRHFDTPRLKDCLRVTIGTRRENDIFLSCLREVLDGGE